MEGSPQESCMNIRDCGIVLQLAALMITYAHSSAAASAAEQTAMDVFLSWQKNLKEAKDIQSLRFISEEKRERILAMPKESQITELKDIQEYALKDLEKVVDVVEGHVATVSANGISTREDGKQRYSRLQVTMVEDDGQWKIYSQVLTSAFSPFNGSEIEPDDKFEERVRKHVKRHWKVVDGENWVSIIVAVQPNKTAGSIRIASDPTNSEAEQAIRDALAKALPLVATENSNVKFPSLMHMTFDSNISEEVSSTSVSGPYFEEREISNWLTHTKSPSITSEKKAQPYNFGDPEKSSIEKNVQDLGAALEKNDLNLAMKYALAATSYFASRPPMEDQLEVSEADAKMIRYEGEFNRYDSRLRKTLIKSGDYAGVERLSRLALDATEKRKEASSQELVTRMSDLAEVYIMQGRDGEADSLIKRIGEIAAATRPAVPTTTKMSITVNPKSMNDPAMKAQLEQFMKSMKAVMGPMSLAGAQTRLYLAYKKKCKDEKAREVEQIISAAPEATTHPAAPATSKPAAPEAAGK